MALSPREVLREAAAAAVETNAGPSDISTDDYGALVDAALADTERLLEAARTFVRLADEFPYDWPNAMSAEAYAAYNDLKTFFTTV